MPWAEEPGRLQSVDGRVRHDWATFTFTFQSALTPLLGFPCGAAGKKSTCNVRDLGSILGLGRSPGEGKGYPLQYSGLENSMDCIVHGVTKSQAWLSDFHFTTPLLVKNSPLCKVARNSLSQEETGEESVVYMLMQLKITHLSSGKAVHCEFQY